MLRLAREVRFSVDRDWAGHIDPSRPPTNSWGGWPSAVGLVPYLKLRIVVSGRPDPQTGYLCNIKTLDDVVRSWAIPAAAEALRACGWRLRPEELLRLAWEALRPRMPPGCGLEALELWTTPYLHYAVSCEAADMIRMTQQFEFSAAHRLHVPSLSDEENRRIFGKCNNPSGHGHNYLLEVTLAGQPDAAGRIFPLPTLERIVREQVIDRLDHKHLNHDLPEFARLNPTVENIARVIWNLLAPHLAGRLHSVRVWETPKTWAEYFGERP